MTFRSICCLLVSLLVVQTAAPQNQTPASGASASQQQNGRDRNGASASRNGDGSSTSETTSPDPLLHLLISKGLLTTAEARSILSSGNAQSQRDQLASLLKDKGLISAAEFEQLRANVPTNSNNAPGNADVVSGTSPGTPATATASAPIPPRPKTPMPSVIASVAPIRFLPINVPAREGLIPDLKLGSGARIKPYGYFKTSVIRDSSSPQGNDFPLPLLAADTGPSGSPEVHLKARALRLGINVEWLDPAPKTTITGRLEVDFEGDFTRVSNRNVSSVRSSQPSIRLAWARIDRRFNDKVAAFALFGQDWARLPSSTLPNMIENTNFGGIGYGAAYQRVPQVRGGFNYNLGGARSWKLQPE